MSDTESDENLERAISMSLQPSDTLQTAIIDLISDDEDDLDVPQHIPVPCQSPGENQREHTDVAEGKIDLGFSSDTPKVLPNNENSGSSTTGILGLDRKAMELERLARLKNKGKMQETSGTELNKRKALNFSSQCEETQKSSRRKVEESFLFDSNRTIEHESMLQSRACPESNSVNKPDSQNHTKTRRTLTHSKLDDISHRGASIGYSNPDQEKCPSSGMQFPNGIIKKTWARDFPRRGDDIKIEEVLQKDDLELAVMSTFQIDSKWIMGKLRDETKVIWVLQAKTEAEKMNWQYQAPTNYQFCFPSMVGNVNCMHSKLQLLAHPSHLRIVIPTANLVPYDWGETGVMENICFLIDLPRHHDRHQTHPEQLTHFGTELLHFLRAKGLKESVVNSICKFDFSRTAHLGFVHSIGGSHVGNPPMGTSWDRTGYPGLATTVKNLGLSNDDDLRIDFLTASMGNLTPNFIKSLFMAAQANKELIERGIGIRGPVIGSHSDLKDRCRIYFPTHETVANSLGGEKSGGTICFQSKWWASIQFPRSLLRDCQSQRKGMLMHSKMWFVRPANPSSGGPAWVYLGSANLSESAWGRLAKDHTSQRPRLHCSNWECGVVFPVRCKDDASERLYDPIDVVFAPHLPIPMVVPGAVYGARLPWAF